MSEKTIIGYWIVTVGKGGKESYEGDTQERLDQIKEQLKKKGKIFSIK